MTTERERMEAELRHAAFRSALVGLLGAWEGKVKANEELLLVEAELELDGVAATYGIDAWLTVEGVNLEHHGQIEVLEYGDILAAHFVEHEDMEPGGEGDEDEMLEILDDSDYEERWV